jgi:hypothetical protein
VGVGAFKYRETIIDVARSLFAALRSRCALSEMAVDGRDGWYGWVCDIACRAKGPLAE